METSHRQASHKQRPVLPRQRAYTPVLQTSDVQASSLLSVYLVFRAVCYSGPPTYVVLRRAAARQQRNHVPSLACMPRSICRLCLSFKLAVVWKSF